MTTSEMAGGRELEAMAVLRGERRWSVDCGDCLELLPLVSAVDHVITDPPYARDVYVRLSMPNTNKGSGSPDRVLGESFAINNGARMGQLAAGAIGSVDDLLQPCAVQFARMTKRWALVFSDVESCHIWRESMKEHGMRYVRTGIWNKPDSMPQMTGDRPAVGFEPATICHAQGAMRWNGGGNRAVWTHNTAKGGERPDHPCPKPLSLMVELIELFTDPDDLIIDPFMGSGTTGMAAVRTGRRFIGFEKEQRWAEIARERLIAEETNSTLSARLAGQQSLFEVAS